MSTRAPFPTLPAFLKARKAGVPLVAIETADPAAAMVKCARSLNGKEEVTPFIRQDIIRGMTSLNKPGAKVLSQLDGIDAASITSPTECLALLVSQADKFRYTPDDNEPDTKVAAVVFIVHANRFLDDTGFMQAAWNARDAWEGIGGTIVLLGPSLKLPVELKNDIVIISEPLPDHVELDGILTSITKEAQLDEEKITDREIVVDTMSGTSAFGARQILAMSITANGVDGDQLWERKRKMIEQCEGLSVYKGTSSFANLGGLTDIKNYLTDILTSGTTPVRAIGFFDEIEKAFAGATDGGLDGGTSKDQLNATLRVMQDFDIPGLILVGHGGTGKSEIAKAAGGIAKCPTIDFDLGAMKAGIVGQSEARIRAAMEVFKAVSQGKGLFIATCNKITTLPPELRRRFTLGTYFVDLPGPEEREKIWPIWTKRFELKASQIKTTPECDGWTGAEIRACCSIAYRTGRTLGEAAKRVVPICKSAPEAIEALRRLASGKFIDATKGGVYKYEPKADGTSAPQGRRIEV